MTKPHSGFVYFLKPTDFDGPIKIGHSRNPARRMKSFLRSSPFPLELLGFVPGGRPDERFLHACFRDQHSHAEWFRHSPELREAIALVIAAQSVGPLREKILPAGPLLRPIPKRTAEQRLRWSYAQRIRRLDDVRNRHGLPRYRHPKDVQDIIQKWRSRQQAIPPAEELRRLDQYIASSVDMFRTGMAA